ncbi:hypothetical protein J7295_01442 [Nakaseomyces glabratus]|nr:hypothetical protein J7298_01436 [Nakaseomyces glabratus]KAH7604150.1 hypothetical protein J7295_01442 [Nakaseomyces glabratus]KAH7614143.1 hypothetical protein J7292_01417 [Nakaseomyces glabratus]
MDGALKRKRQFTFDDFTTVKVVSRPEKLAKVIPAPSTADGDDKADPEAIEVLSEETEIEHTLRLKQFSKEDTIKSSHVSIDTGTYGEYGNADLMKLLKLNPVAYAGRIVKIMAMIDKFDACFDPHLHSLTFRDFEVGLSLVDVGGNTDTDAEDKMDLLLFTFLKLLNVQSVKSNFNPPTLHQLKNGNKPYSKMFSKVRTISSTSDWGYPREWRQLADEENPINTLTLSRAGLKVLEPNDRILLLGCLSDWCLSYAPHINAEIFRLSHLKEEPSIGITTYMMPNYTAKTYDEIRDDYLALCKSERERYELRWKRRHSYKSANFDKKFEIYKKIREKYYAASYTERDNIDIRLYDLWSKLFEFEGLDNPLNDPYTNEVYKLRKLESLAMALKDIGEFYVPSLSSYKDSNKKNTKNGMTIKRRMDSYKYKGFCKDHSIVTKQSGCISEFTLLFFDKVKLARDITQGTDKKGDSYWYALARNDNEFEQLISNLKDLEKLSFEKSDDKMKFLLQNVKEWQDIGTAISRSNLQTTSAEESTSGERIRNLRSRKALHEAFDYTESDNEDLDNTSDYDDDVIDSVDEFSEADTSVVEEHSLTRAERLQRRKLRRY